MALLLQPLCSQLDPVYFPHSTGRSLNWPDISPGTVSDDQAGNDGQTITLGPAGEALVTGLVVQPPTSPLSLHWGSVVRAGGKGPF